MNDRGYTLVELVVVMVLAGVMLFLAIPSLRYALLTDPLQSEAGRLSALVRELRVDAMREQLDYVLYFDVPRHRYWTYTENMTPEEREDRRKKGVSLESGIKMTDIYHVGDVKKTDVGIETVFYKSGMAQPTVVHLSRDDQSMTLIIEPFLSEVRTFAGYVEFPGDEDKQ